MIISKIFGGLGNQMFQYAAGRALAQKLHSELKLDVTSYDVEDVFKRKFGLDAFSMPIEIAKKSDLARFQNGRILRLIERLVPYYKRKIVNEREFSFDYNFKKIRSESLICGYWQTELYFKNIEFALRHEFTLKKISSKALSFIEDIKKHKSVSVHVRRADYVSMQHVNDIHGVCSAAYYDKAIGLMTEKIGQAHYYVFSDDIAWAKEHIKIPSVVIVSGSGLMDYEEMIIMSKCQNNIIANSSFSWWGAWLNNNDDKIVIAPVKWFNDQTINTEDLIPKNWIRI